MSVRRKTTNRLTLYRNCGTCGKSIVTTADTPWVRQMERDGKRQVTTYFCSSECYQASYKHIGWYDGKCAERKRQRDAQRDRREYNRRYYAEHRDAICARHRENYWADHESALATGSYNRKKRRLIASCGVM